MRFNTCTSVLFAALAALILWAAPTSAQNDLIFLSRLTGPTEISFDRLTANDMAGPPSTTPTFSSTSRGSLSVGANSVTYSPSPGFRQFGLDSFQYSYSASGADNQTLTINATVFLVADLKVSLVPLDPPGATAPAWSRLDLLSLSPPTTPPPGAQSFTATVNGQDGFLLYSSLANDPEPPSGGTMIFELDVGECDVCATVIARTSFGNTSAFELILESGEMIFARAWLDDGSYVDTAKVPISQNAIEVTWWMEHAGGAGDGGLILLVDGEMVGELTALENHGFTTAATLAQRFGTMDSTGGPGTLDFLNVRMWTSEQPLRYRPRFADGAESNSFDSWSTITPNGQLAVNSLASSLTQRSFSVTAAIGTTAAMVHSTTNDEHSLRLRFMLDGYSLSAGTRTRLVVASDPVNSTPAFEVELRRRSDRVKLRLLAVQDDGSQSISPWLVFFDEEGPLQVDLAWWAATAGSTGGFDFQVTGTTLKRSTQTLDNGGSRIDQLDFGATNTTTGSTSAKPDGGYLLLDDIEIWY